MELEIYHIDPTMIMSNAAHNKPFTCSFCGDPYFEHKDFESFFQGAYDENGKIACCKKCFDKGFEEA